MHVIVNAAHRSSLVVDSRSLYVTTALAVLPPRVYREGEPVLLAADVRQVRVELICVRL